VAYTTLYRVLRSNHVPDSENLLCILKWIDVPLEQVTSGEDEAESVDQHEHAGGDEDNNEDDEPAKIMRASTGSTWSLMGLALSISLDELAVGFSLGLLGLPLTPILALIALQALLLSVAGQWIGRNAGQRLGPYAEQLVGPLFCILGAWFLVAERLGLPF
jgi:putative Mn2+ efflux pump MntP